MTTVIRSMLAAGLLLTFATGSALAATLEELIAAAETTFGGEAFDSELSGGRAEIDLLVGNQIVDALYDADTGALIASDTSGGPRRVQQVRAALATANLSLLDAVAAAQGAVGPGEVLEADLVVSRRVAGRIFIIDIRTGGGVLDVFVNSANGNIVRVIPD